MIYTVKPQKVSIYINSAQRTIAQVKAETGCDAVINGGLFDGAFRPVCHLKANGRVFVADQYLYWGYGWDDNDPKLMVSNTISAVKNYIACVCLVRNGQAEYLIYNKDLGGARQRTAIGRYPDGRLWLYCDKAGKTPEQLQRIALDAGLESAIMLDGGGSSQCIFPAGSVTSSRIVHNLICVWADDEQKEGGEKMKICIDPGHGYAERSNQSPDGRYFEYLFTFDFSTRLKKILERCGFEVMLTKETAEETPGLAERARRANAWGADFYLSPHTNAAGGSGWASPSGITAHIYGHGGTREAVAKELIAQFVVDGLGVFNRTPYVNNFQVLRDSNMPAVLVEYGFHTSKSDVEQLLTSAHRDKLAVSTAKALCKHFKVPYVDEPTKPADGTIYRVQVGAFSVEENATKLKAELEAKGYKPFIVKEKKV